MPTGMLGKKIGMTRIFDADGRAVAVTVIEAGPCVVVQRKTVDVDGYEAVQLGFQDRSYARTNSPMTGHFESKGVSPKKHLQEFELAKGEDVSPGDEITVEMFEPGQIVNVIGITKGKGFAGAMKRHGFHGGPASHGSKVHRAPMSAGATDAARVFPGQRMPGHMGHVQRKIKNLRVVEVDAENNMLVVKGAIPGPNGAVVAIEAK
ncbi:MAG TPA: 50S ribosomal protein L3 [Armatimonadetes bacterium]|nr:50S ribosomal protein L3 [Armatimonadota bacterium]